jgi:MFS transporter, DHA1 family, tetracycline resistance protein
MNKNLRLVLVTAFLDLLGFGILIPSLPAISQHFGMSGSWTVWSQAIYSLGMFVSGAIIGSLSDKYGRRPMLLVANGLNILGYILMGVSYFMVGHLETMLAFSLFILSRFVSGTGGSGFSVIQAYVSDISTPEEKTKNMGMIGATFGVAFLVGPAIGGILGELGGVPTIVGLSLIIMLINTLYIYTTLPEPSRHNAEKPDRANIHYGAVIVFLLVISLLSTIGFSSIQGGSTQYYADIFYFTQREIGFSMSAVGIASIIYQGFLVKHIRKILSDESMLMMGITILMISLYFFALNRSSLLLVPILFSIPIGMGSLNPSLISLLGKNSSGHVGKIMGINSSVTGIGGIIGPIIVGILYAEHPSSPYYAASALFGLMLIGSFLFLRSRKEALET